MTIKTIYDSAGMIVRVVTLTGDPVEDALIEIIPPGGASVAGDYDSETIYFLAGVATARPAVVVDPAYEIVADGEDSFWFEVPDETHISTSEGTFEAAVADALVSVSSRLIGTQRILVVPPLPYQQIAIMVSVIADDGGAPNLPPTTPDIEILFSQTVLGSLVVLAKPKFNVLSWDISSDPEHAYYGLTRYESEADAIADTSGVDIEPIYEAFYKDADEFVSGVDCWYRVYDVDGNGNRGEKSDPAGEVARGALAGDIEPQAATPSKLFRPAANGLLRDNGLFEQENWGFTHWPRTVFASSSAMSASNIEQEINASDYGLGTSDYRFKLTGTGVGDAVRIESDRLTPVRPGLQYELSAFIENVSGSSFDVVSVNITWFERDSAGDLVEYVPGLYPLGSEDTISAVSGTKMQATYVTQEAPSTVSFASVSVIASPTSGNAVVPVVRVASIYIRELADDFDATEFYEHEDLATTGAFGSITKKITEFSIPAGRSAKRALFHCEFKNISGAAKRYAIELRRYSVGTGIETTLADKASWQVTDLAFMPAALMVNDIISRGTDFVYRVYVLASDASNELNNMRVMVDMRHA